MRTFWITCALGALACWSAAAPAAERPQTPRSPLPYPSREVRIVSQADGIALAGTLCLPERKTRAPAVLLLGVAGPNDRDLNFAGHRAFAVLADHLCRTGFATLRLDDRGVDGSEGDWRTAGFDTLAADAASAIRFLRQEPGVDARNVFPVGLSEGAAIAMLLAAHDRRVPGVVLLSPPGLPGRVALRQSFERTLAISGVMGEAAVTRRAQLDEFLRLAAAAPISPQAQAELAGFLRGPGGALVPPYSFMPRDPIAQAALFAGDWYQSQLAWNPDTQVRRWRTPVLIVGGDRDQILPPAEHHPPLRALFGRKADAIVIEGISHLLQPAKTGLPQEYATTEITVEPRVLEAVATWLRHATNSKGHTRF